ncbi:phage holin family protein [Flavicella marina]|uniref:phage holin family protein n=1 Tax=Flavicella marina TaxID=1475951 RepID=UPI0012644535|nr:phage holin family protein [Flavicella marina]
MKTLIKILVTAVAVLIISKLMPSITVTNYTSAVWVAAVLALLNTFLRPILVLLTLPATILSMGLFIFVINAGIVLMASNMVDGFVVSGFFSALLFSLLLWGVRAVLFSVLLEDDQTPRNRIS